MKVTGIRELRANSAAVLGSREPVLVTKHGKVAGVYVPLEDPKSIPEDLRKELVAVIGNHLAKILQRKGITEKHIEKDFDAYRKRRR